jgi:hypothetical protein
VQVLTVCRRISELFATGLGLGVAMRHASP